MQNPPSKSRLRYFGRSLENGRHRLLSLSRFRVLAEIDSFWACKNNCVSYWIHLSIPSCSNTREVLHCQLIRFAVELQIGRGRLLCTPPRSHVSPEERPQAILHVGISGGNVCNTFCKPKNEPQITSNARADDYLNTYML